MNMKSERMNLFLAFIGMSGAVVLLSAYLLTLLGIVNLQYLGDIPVMCNWFLNSVMFFVCIAFSNGIPLGLNVKVMLVVGLVYMPIHVLAYLVFGSGWVVSGLAPVVYSLIVSLILKRGWKVAVLVIVFNAVVVILQYITEFIKGFYFTMESTNSNTFTGFLLSIDLYLFFLYAYTTKEVRRYAIKYLVLSKGKCLRSTAEAGQKVLIEDDLTQRQKVIFVFLSQGYQVCQLLVVLAIGLLQNAILELTIMLVMFWIGRKILQKSWHSEKLWICSCAAFSGFYILTNITLPLQVSLLATVALSGGFVYLMHILGVKQEKLEELERWYTPEKQFRKRLNDHGFFGVKEEIAVLHHIRKETIKEIAERVGYSEQTCKNYYGQVLKALPDLKKRKTLK